MIARCKSIKVTCWRCVNEDLFEEEVVSCVSRPTVFPIGAVARTLQVVRWLPVPSPSTHTFIVMHPTLLHVHPHQDFQPICCNDTGPTLSATTSPAADMTEIEHMIAVFDEDPRRWMTPSSKSKRQASRAKPWRAAELSGLRPLYGAQYRVQQADHHDQFGLV